MQLALDEIKAEYTTCTIDTRNKPEWYTTLVNPRGKVSSVHDPSLARTRIEMSTAVQIPAIAYGGSKAEDGEPSLDSIKVIESTIILEFLADLYPNSGLLPTDPILRTKARLFINHFDIKVWPSFRDYCLGRENAATLLDVIDMLQKLLPAETGFATGDKWCMADMAVAPFLALFEVILKHELGQYPIGEGNKTLVAIRDKTRFSRYNLYVADLMAQPTFQANWDEVSSLLLMTDAGTSKLNTASECPTGELESQSWTSA